LIIENGDMIFFRLIAWEIIKKLENIVLIIHEWCFAPLGASWYYLKTLLPIFTKEANLKKI
jgi:hypothetical protein